MAAQPAFTDIADTSFQAGNALTSDLLTELADNAKFGVTRLERLFMGFYTNGATIPRPISPVDGYLYSYAEVLFEHQLVLTRAPAPGFISGQSLPPEISAAQKGNRIYSYADVNNSNGVVTIQSVTGDVDGKNASGTNDGVVKVYAWCQRNHSLAIAVIPTFYDLSDSVLVSGEPLVDVALKDLSHNAQYAAVRPEIIAMGFFANGATVPLPVSPVDGYTYSRSEVQYVAMDTTTRAPGAGFANGQATPPVAFHTQPSALYYHLFDVDDTSGYVSTTTSYWDGKTEVPSGDGCVKVYALCQRNDISDQLGVITGPPFSLNPAGPLPWWPGASPVTINDNFFDNPWDQSRATFSLAQTYLPNADGSVDALLLVGGPYPVNNFSKVLPFPPIIGAITTAPTGGQLKGGQTYYLALCAIDADGYFSRPSTIALVRIPAGTDTNTIVLSNITWPNGTAGWSVYAATNTQQLSFQGIDFGGVDTGSYITYTGTEATPTTLTFVGDSANFPTLGMFLRSMGMPDIGFQFLRFKVKDVIHGGIWGSNVDTVDATHITVGISGAWTPDQFAGRWVSLVGRYNNSAIMAVADFKVLHNDIAGVMTLDTPQPDPTVVGLVANDVVVMRTQATDVGTDPTGDYIEDALFDNPYAPGGLVTNAEAGNLIRFVTGPNAGYTVRIASNTGIRLYIVGTWPIETPNVGDSFIIESSSWLSPFDQNDTPNSDYTHVAKITLDVPNVTNSLLLVSAVSVRGDGVESPDGENLFRMVWIFGQAAPNASSIATIPVPGFLQVGSDIALPIVLAAGVVVDHMEAIVDIAPTGADIIGQLLQDGTPWGDVFTISIGTVTSGFFAPGAPDGLQHTYTLNLTQVGDAIANQNLTVYIY